MKAGGHACSVRLQHSVYDAENADRVVAAERLDKQRQVLATAVQTKTEQGEKDAAKRRGQSWRKASSERTCRPPACAAALTPLVFLVIPIDVVPS